jgi:hypothetical protein
MEKFIEYLEEANKITKTADHMLYVTFPLVKDKKILIKILKELKKATAYCINSILQYEYLLRRISLYKDPQMNFRTFLIKCAPLYKLSKQEVQEIQEIFLLIKNHEQSAMEFTRGEKLVIITENETKTLEIKQIKKFINLNKKLIEKTQNRILRKV